MDIPAGSGAERRRAQLTVSDITAYATGWRRGEEGEFRAASEIGNPWNFGSRR